MDKKSQENYSKCLYHCRLEILGVILILIATVLTVISLNGLGIFALFLVGGLLCCHRCCLKPKCDDSTEEESKPAPSKRTRRRPKKVTGDDQAST